MLYNQCWLQKILLLFCRGNLKVLIIRRDLNNFINLRNYLSNKKCFSVFSSQFGVLPANTTKAQLSDREPSFQTVFNHTWADHANLISVQYAGTGALKTDYTRTGKVT